MKKIMAILLCACVLFCAVGCVPQVDAADDASAVILQKLGIMKGTELGLETERNVTRAEALTLIYRVCGLSTEAALSEDATTVFSDAQGHWAQYVIEDAYQNGYVSGISESEFAPERTMTGREFVKMLLSVLGYADITIENAYERGIALSLLLHKETKQAVESDAVLTRGVVATLCHSALLIQTPQGQMVKQMLVEKGIYTESDFSVMVSGTPVAATNFEDKLYGEMANDVNFMLSPLSIKMAFALVANGAQDETKQELLDALDIEDLDAYNTYAAQLLEKYNAAGVMELNLANALWVNSSKTPSAFQPAYVQTMQDWYSAKVDAVTDEDAVEKINAWVSEQTRGKIPTLIQNSDFYTALVNAVYFKAAWQNEFSESMTQKDTFYNADGSVAETDFMSQTQYLSYGEAHGVRILELPYKNYVDKADEEGNFLERERFKDLDVSMYLLLGDGAVHNPKSLLEQATLTQTRVRVTLPKFESDFQVELNDIMRSLGVCRAFDMHAAQINGILENQPLYLQSGVHKTYIKVDEKGTEAAAVTGIFAGATSAKPTEPIAFKADKPFTYVIRDNVNGEILFMGRYAQVK